MFAIVYAKKLGVFEVKQIIRLIVIHSAFFKKVCVAEFAIAFISATAFRGGALTIFRQTTFTYVQLAIVAQEIFAATLITKLVVAKLAATANVIVVVIRPANVLSRERNLLPASICIVVGCHSYVLRVCVRRALYKLLSSHIDCATVA